MEIYNMFIMNTAYNLLFMAIYIASLIYMVRMNHKLAKQTVVYPFLLMVLIIFNPISYGIIMNIPSFFGVFGRFFWVGTIFLVDAIALAYIVTKQQKGTMMLLATVFCLTLVVSGGGTKIWYSEDENIYKIPQYVIDMDEVISEVKEEENPTIISYEDVFFYIRQYDPTLLSYGNLGYLTDEMKENMGEDTLEQYGKMYEFITGSQGYEVAASSEEINEFINALGIDFVCSKTDKLAAITLKDYTIECIYAENEQYVFQVILK